MTWAELEKWVERNGMLRPVLIPGTLTYCCQMSIDRRGSTWITTRHYDEASSAKRALCRAVAKIREAT